MVRLSNNVEIRAEELEFSAIRAQGAGGQNVNKVSSAVHLRFDIKNSSLPDFYKQRLLQLSDQRITADGVLIIKAQKYRTQARNKEDAIRRLLSIIENAVRVQKVRKPTRPARSSVKKRLDQKTRHGQNKKLRKSVDY